MRIIWVGGAEYLHLSWDFPDWKNWTFKADILIKLIILTSGFCHKTGRFSIQMDSLFSLHPAAKVRPEVRTFSTC